MVIRFVDNKADNMSFYTNPEATFIPPHELDEPDTRLKGFAWREDERPTLENILAPPSESEIIEGETENEGEGEVKDEAESEVGDKAEGESNQPLKPKAGKTINPAKSNQ
jgi:hypothetical protein